MRGTLTADACAGTGDCLIPPAEFVRLRYFFGQRLGVVDLADEQSYLAGKQRFHNLRAHGAGVLCGLRAYRYVYPQGSPPSSPATLLRVSRGAALDWCGREIVVGWDQCIDVAAWFAQHPEAQKAVASGASTLRLWVALCYRECPSDPAPAPRDPCGCDAGGCEFARIREGFELRLLTDAEAGELAPGEEPPAGAEPISEETLGGTLESAYARAATLAAAAGCPEYPDVCLPLANFQAKLDSSRAHLATGSRQPDADHRRHDPAVCLRRRNGLQLHGLVHRRLHRQHQRSTRIQLHCNGQFPDRVLRADG
jgi:hypothetical protein